MSDSMETCGRGGKLRTSGASAVFAGKHYHFIGAGGVGMSGLAKLLLDNEAVVTGSDAAESRVLERLREAGADVRAGHGGWDFNGDLEGVVISAAIRQDNPELLAARTGGADVYKYAEMLGAVMDGYEGVAVSGTHGKSTSGGWLVHLLKQAAVDCNYIIGADIVQLGSSSGVGVSDIFVAEACEYDRSFLNLKPAVACVLNIEADHLDYYADEQQIIEAFAQFAAGVREGGKLIANGDDANVRKMLELLDGKVEFETFGFGVDCDWRAVDIRLEAGLYSFDVVLRGRTVGRAQISLPGKHNVANALAVTAMAAAVGVEPELAVSLLGAFTGMDRRMMFKAQLGGITILDDYAHHPTEIRAALAAIREKYGPDRRLWCVFEPHQYSRTRFLLDDFAESFKLADVTILPQIYFVRDTEQSRCQVNSQMLVERIRNNGCEAVFVERFEEICRYLESRVADGDIVVTMGAGNVWKVADEYIQWLRRSR